MTTTFPKVSEIQQQWYIVDAKDQILGRLAVRIADVLRGKNKPTYTPHLDTGDFVIVINSEKIGVTGNKLKNKEYQRYSGYPGGQKVQTLETVLTKQPERVIRHAVKGMVPSGPLGRKMLTKLKVYAGEQHPHQAQQPKPLLAVAQSA